jgi:hypothetical protein
MVKELRSQHLNSKRSSEEKNLLQIRSINPRIAQVLIENGFTLLQHIAECSKELLAQYLLSSITFEVCSHPELHMLRTSMAFTKLSIFLCMHQDDQTGPTEKDDSIHWKNVNLKAEEIILAARYQ